MKSIKRKPNFSRNLYEKEFWSQLKPVIGVDEVGLSCLARPVVAAAVMLKPHKRNRLL